MCLLKTAVCLIQVLFNVFAFFFYKAPTPSSFLHMHIHSQGPLIPDIHVQLRHKFPASHCNTGN